MERYPDFFKKTNNEKVDKKERKNKKDQDEKEEPKSSSFLEAIKSLFTRDQSRDEIERMRKEVERSRRLQEQGEGRPNVEDQIATDTEAFNRIPYQPEREQSESEADNFYNNRFINFLGNKILKYIGLEPALNYGSNEAYTQTRSFIENQQNRAEQAENIERLNNVDQSETSVATNYEFGGQVPEENVMDHERADRFEYEQRQPEITEADNNYDTGYPTGEPGRYSAVSAGSVEKDKTRVVESKNQPKSTVFEWLKMNKQKRENKALKKAIKNTEDKLSDQSTELKEQERLVKRLQALKEIERKPNFVNYSQPSISSGEKLSTDKQSSSERDRQTGKQVAEKPKTEVIDVNKTEEIPLSEGKSIKVDRSRMQTDRGMETANSRDDKEYTPEFSQFYRNQDLAGRSEADLIQEKEEMLKKNNLILDNKIIEKIKKKDLINQALQPKNIRQDPNLSAFYTLIIVFSIIILLIIFT